MYVARRHRHSTPPVIDGALTLAIDKVRGDKFDNDWVLAGFEGRDNVQLVASGIGGIEVGYPVAYASVHNIEFCFQLQIILSMWCSDRYFGRASL